MSEANKEVIRRVYDEIVSGGRYEALDELVREDVIENEEMPEGMPSGRNGIRAVFEMMREAFPDLRAEISQIVAEGDMVAAHVTFSGTQEKEFMGAPSQGKRFEAPVMDLFRLEDGVVAEHWGVMDQMGMLEQLGAIEAPA